MNRWGLGWDKGWSLTPTPPIAYKEPLSGKINIGNVCHTIHRVTRTWDLIVWANLLVQYTRTCTIYPYMYNIPVHVQYTRTCTIYPYMYNSPIHVQYTHTCTIYQYMYNIPVHVQHTRTCTIYPWHVTISYIKINSNIHLLPNDIFIHVFFSMCLVIPTLTLSRGYWSSLRIG